MNREFTNIVKFICCVLIFLHHYFLGEIWVSTFGRMACAVFFFLSSYGIVNSLQKSSLSLLEFSKKRLIKVYTPLLFVNIVTIIITSIVVGLGAIPVFNVFCDRISLHETTITETFLYAFNWHKMDSVTWFIDCLLICYLFLWGVEKVEARKKRILVAIVCYVLIVGTTFKITPPTWYVIDTSGLMCGLFVAEFEPVVERYLTKKKTVISLLSVFALTTVSDIVFQDLFLGRYLKMLTIMYSITACMLVCSASFKATIKCTKVATYLGGLSFFVYLVHIKISNLVNIYCPNAILALTASLFAAVILYKVYNFMSIRKNII